MKSLKEKHQQKVQELKIKHHAEVSRIQEKNKISKVSPKSKQPDFLDNLMDYESGEMTPKEETKFLKGNKNTLMRLQGHYGRTMKARGIIK